MKCAFGVSSGKFLGFMVSQWGIEANLEKVKAILEMTSRRNVKEVQRLTRRVALLNRFVSRATNKFPPFFKTLEQAFTWTNECKVAFQELKCYLGTPPLLSPSKEGKDLFLYLVVSAMAVSVAFIREESRIQHPVYYVSHAFQGVEAKYPRIKKITFSLIVSSWKLRPYFQVNPILFMTDQPIKKAINKPDAAGRMVQWAVELSQFDIECRPQTIIKAQVLADFIVEFKMPEDRPMDVTKSWTVQTDGSLAKGREGVRVIITSLEGDALKYGVQLQFPATNNEVQ